MPHDSTQWRRKDRTRVMLEAEGYTVTATGCGRAEPFHLIATNSRRVRLVHVDTGGEIRDADGWMRAMRVPPNVTREIWRWIANAREPEVMIVVTGRGRRWRKA